MLSINALQHIIRSYRLIWCLFLCLPLLWFSESGFTGADAESEPPTLVIGIGDSLTHGTMDATNNSTNTLNGFLQLVVDRLDDVTPLHFVQPLFDEQENRINPAIVPTNLAVDGADSFTVEGIRYYRRAGVDESFIDESLLSDKFLPSRLDDKYDKVMYPINLLARQPVSQIGSAKWLLRTGAPNVGIDRAIVMFWVGNNDSSLAALGGGGSNPEFQPIPFEQVAPELNPLLRLLFGFGRLVGEVSFEPYTPDSITRNLTDLQEFANQYQRLVNRLRLAYAFSPVETDLFLLTLPYYSAVGYLFDSDDIEYYLQKLDPAYTVPSTFKRVAPPGEPITDPLKGDRISLLTFGLMYALMSTGYSVDYVNEVLEQDGEQRDGLVLSEAESQFIRVRIDGFNAAIKATAESGGPSVHAIDVGQYLNDALTGKIEIIVDGRVLSRKWVRGGGFTLDGVHPGYTGQALIANFVLEELNNVLGLEASTYDLDEVSAGDPYVDRDGDGWAPGPSYEASGIAKLLFQFKDPDDGDAGVQAAMPPDIWDIISDILLRQILGIKAVSDEAARLGYVSTE